MFSENSGAFKKTFRIQESFRGSMILEKCWTALETKWEMLEIVENPKMSLQMSKSSITYANNFRDFENF